MSHQETVSEKTRIEPPIIGADVLAALSPERQERVETLRSAMAEKFSTNEQRLSSKDFGVVADGEGENQKTVVMLITDNGLNRGGYGSIMEDLLWPVWVGDIIPDEKNQKQAYGIEADGQEIDTRLAMTWEVYKAFIEQAKAAGIDPLPDSCELSEQKQNGEPWTQTWLTGDDLPRSPEDNAPTGHVYEREPCVGRYTCGGDSEDLRFRPSAVV